MFPPVLAGDLMLHRSLWRKGVVPVSPCVQSSLPNLSKFDVAAVLWLAIYYHRIDIWETWALSKAQSQKDIGGKKWGVAGVTGEKESRCCDGEWGQGERGEAEIGNGLDFLTDGSQSRSEIPRTSKTSPVWLPNSPMNLHFSCRSTHPHPIFLFLSFSTLYLSIICFFFWSSRNTRNVTPTLG